MKGVLAGLAALFTFSGTDSDRLFWVAVVFGVTVYAGAARCATFSLKLDALPSRWGYLPPRRRRSGCCSRRASPRLRAYGLIGTASVGRHRLEARLGAAAEAVGSAR